MVPTNSAAACLALAAVWCVPQVRGQALPPKLREALKVQLKASEAQVRQVEGGGVTAYVVDTGNPEDVLLVGAARIWATPARFVQQYRDITRFESAPGVLAAGRFSAPPQLSDLQGLALTRDEVDDLKACRPGNCDFKIGQRGMTYLQGKVNWRASDYIAQANRVFREMWLEYLREYQRTGNQALARYHDQPKMFSVEHGLNQLIRTTPVLSAMAPQMADYLQQYPRLKVPWAEELFYWQLGDFGLKPVHRLTHVVIGKGPTLYGDGYLIASKMLFASHYFRSAIELRFLVPGQDQSKGGMHYLICVQRSYVDGLTGLKGRLIRGTILSRSRQSMESYVSGVKRKVEQSSNGKR